MDKKARRNGKDGKEPKEQAEEVAEATVVLGKKGVVAGDGDKNRTAGNYGLENPDDTSSEDEEIGVGASSSTQNPFARRAPVTPLSKIPAPLTPPLPTDRPSDETSDPKDVPPRPAPGTPQTPPGAAVFAAQLPLLTSRVFEALQVFLLKITPPSI